jgi:Domain of unknown function (DUF4389)
VSETTSETEARRERGAEGWDHGLVGCVNSVGHHKTFDLQARPSLRTPHAYPESLSRGLVLVKWWLLAIPHYLVVAVFAGGGLAAWAGGGGGWVSSSGGLVGLLVCIAGVILLFTGRYPKSLYDFVMGMNRWVFRVAAYSSLMTDSYPPFRLDMGGDEPPADTLNQAIPPTPVLAL